MTTVAGLASDVEILAHDCNLVVYRPGAGAVRFREREHVWTVLNRLAAAAPLPLSTPSDEHRIYDRLVASLENAGLLVERSGTNLVGRPDEGATTPRPLLRPAEVIWLDPISVRGEQTRALITGSWSDLALIARSRPRSEARWMVCRSRLSGDVKVTTPFGGAGSTMCWACLRDRVLGHDDVTRAMWPHLLTGDAVRMTTMTPSSTGLVALLSALDTEPPAGGVWEVPPDVDQPVLRPVLPYASCDHAGAAGSSWTAVRRQRTGLRAMSRTLTPLCSPLTGVVASVRTVRTPGLPLVVAAARYSGERVRAAEGPDDTTEALALRERTAFGIGWNAADARTFAVLEAIERYCALRQPHDAVLNRGVLRERSHWCPGLRRLVDPGDHGARCCSELEWLRCHSVGPDKDPVVVPAETCFEHYQRPAVRGSTGAAVEQTQKRAIVAGFLEVIEREAVNAWWFGRCDAQRLDPGAIDEALVSTVHAHLRDRGRSLVLFLLPTAVTGVDTVVAMTGLGELGFPMLGMGAGFTMRAASVKAMRELGQVLAFERGEEQKWRSTPLTTLRWLADQQRTAVTPTARSHCDPRPDAFDRAVGAAARAGRRTLVYDYDRPEVPLPCVRVMLTPAVGYAEKATRLREGVSLPW